MNRQYAIDGLRGLACISVVFYHYLFRFGQLFPGMSDYGNGYTYFLQFGVDLFFLISGFVILMTAENSENLRQFAVSRLSRLYPAYWASVPITYVVVCFFGLPGREVSFFQFLANLTMLNGFVGIPNVDGVYWSLKIELIFYFLIGAVILFNKISLINYVVAVWLLLAIVFGYVPGFSGVKVIMAASYASHFSAGMVLYEYSKFRRFSMGMAALSFLAICSAFVNKGAEGALVLIVLFVFFGAVLKLGFLNRLFSSYVLTFLGGISYALYLVHQNIGYVALRELGKYVPFELAVGITVALSITLAWLITRFVDVPGRKIVKRALSNKRVLA